MRYAVNEITECSGHCCEQFTIPYAPEELDRVRQSAFPESNKQVADMVIYLGMRTVSPSGIALDTPAHYYTCKHFVDRRCAIYETRPAMCAEYPYDNCGDSKCNYTGCTRTVERTPLYALRYPFNRKLSESI